MDSDPIATADQVTTRGRASFRAPFAFFSSRLSLGRYAGVLAGLLVLCAYLALTQPIFLTWSNWRNIIGASTVLAVLGLGATLVLLTGHLDMSFGSMTAACAVTLGITLGAGWPWLGAVAICLIAGTFMGIINGVLIALLRIPFFVVTLGTLYLYASLALTITKGETKSLFGSDNIMFINGLARGSVGPLPTLIIVLAVLYAVGGVVLHFTTYGRSIYLVGSNPEAARLAGIKVKWVVASVFAISGLTAGLAAIVLVGRLTAAPPTVDSSVLLQVIAAVLIGGTSFNGGDGGLVGTIIGVLFLGVVQNALSLTGVSTFLQGTVSGLILIIAVGLGVLRQHGAGVRRGWTEALWRFRRRNIDRSG